MPQRRTSPKSKGGAATESNVGEEPVAPRVTPPRGSPGEGGLPRSSSSPDDTNPITKRFDYTFLPQYKHKQAIKSLIENGLYYMSISNNISALASFSSAATYVYALKQSDTETGPEHRFGIEQLLKSLLGYVEALQEKTRHTSGGSHGSGDNKDDDNEDNWQANCEKVGCEADPNGLNLTFKDVVGMEREKNVFFSAISYPLIYPNLYTKGAKGILLYGPPGTGKTLVVKAAIKELAIRFPEMRVNFFPLTGADLKGKYVGETEKKIVRAYTCAARRACQKSDPGYEGKTPGESCKTCPQAIAELKKILTDFKTKNPGKDDKALSTVLRKGHTITDADGKTKKVRYPQYVSVIFIDEFEGVGGDRSKDETGMVANAVNTLLQMMDGVSSFENVITVAATNYPWNLDAALLRRFNEQIFCDVPSFDNIKKLITAESKNRFQIASKDKYEYCGGLTQPKFDIRDDFKKAFMNGKKEEDCNSPPKADKPKCVDELKDDCGILKVIDMSYLKDYSSEILACVSRMKEDNYSNSDVAAVMQKAHNLVSEAALRSGIWKIATFPNKEKENVKYYISRSTRINTSTDKNFAEAADLIERAASLDTKYTYGTNTGGSRYTWQAASSDEDFMRRLFRRIGKDPSTVLTAAMRERTKANVGVVQGDIDDFKKNDTQILDFTHNTVKNGIYIDKNEALTSIFHNKIPTDEKGEEILTEQTICNIRYWGKDPLLHFSSDTYQNALREGFYNTFFEIVPAAAVLALPAAAIYTVLTTGTCTLTYAAGLPYASVVNYFRMIQYAGDIPLKLYRGLENLGTVGRSFYTDPSKYVYQFSPGEVATLGIDKAAAVKDWVLQAWMAARGVTGIIPANPGVAAYVPPHGTFAFVNQTFAANGTVPFVTPIVGPFAGGAAEGTAETVPKSSRLVTGLGAQRRGAGAVAAAAGTLPTLPPPAPAPSGSTPSKYPFPPLIPFNPTTAAAPSGSTPSRYPIAPFAAAAKSGPASTPSKQESPHQTAPPQTAPPPTAPPQTAPPPPAADPPLPPIKARTYPDPLSSPTDSSPYGFQPPPLAPASFSAAAAATAEEEAEAAEVAAALAAAMAAAMVAAEQASQDLSPEAQMAAVKMAADKTLQGVSTGGEATLSETLDLQSEANPDETHAEAEKELIAKPLKANLTELAANAAAVSPANVQAELTNVLGETVLTALAEEAPPPVKAPKPAKAANPAAEDPAPASPKGPSIASAGSFSGSTPEERAKDFIKQWAAEAIKLKEYGVDSKKVYEGSKHFQTIFNDKSPKGWIKRNLALAALSGIDITHIQNALYDGLTPRNFVNIKFINNLPSILTFNDKTVDEMFFDLNQVDAVNKIIEIRRKDKTADIKKSIAELLHPEGLMEVLFLKTYDLDYEFYPEKVDGIDTAFSLIRELSAKYQSEMEFINNGVRPMEIKTATWVEYIKSWFPDSSYDPYKRPSSPPYSKMKDEGFIDAVKMCYDTLMILKDVPENANFSKKSKDEITSIGKAFDFFKNIQEGIVRTESKYFKKDSKGAVITDKDGKQVPADMNTLSGVIGAEPSYYVTPNYTGWNSNFFILVEKMINFKIDNNIKKEICKQHIINTLVEIDGAEYIDEANGATVEARGLGRPNYEVLKAISTAATNKSSHGAAAAVARLTKVKEQAAKYLANRYPGTNIDTARYDGNDTGNIITEPALKIDERTTKLIPTIVSHNMDTIYNKFYTWQTDIINCIDAGVNSQMETIFSTRPAYYEEEAANLKTIKVLMKDTLTNLSSSSEGSFTEEKKTKSKKVIYFKALFKPFSAGWVEHKACGPTMNVKNIASKLADNTLGVGWRGVKAGGLAVGRFAGRYLGSFSQENIDAAAEQRVQTEREVELVKDSETIAERMAESNITALKYLLLRTTEIGICEGKTDESFHRIIKPKFKQHILKEEGKALELKAKYAAEQKDAAALARQVAGQKKYEEADAGAEFVINVASGGGGDDIDFVESPRKHYQKTKRTRRNKKGGSAPQTHEPAPRQNTTARNRAAKSTSDILPGLYPSDTPTEAKIIWFRIDKVTKIGESQSVFTSELVNKDALLLGTAERFGRLVYEPFKKAYEVVGRGVTSMYSTPATYFHTFKNKEDNVYIVNIAIAEMFGNEGVPLRTPRPQLDKPDFFRRNFNGIFAANYEVAINRVNEWFRVKEYTKLSVIQTCASYINLKEVRTPPTEDVDKTNFLCFYMDASYIGAAIKAYPSTYNNSTASMLTDYANNRSNFLTSYQAGEYDKGGKKAKEAATKKKK